METQDVTLEEERPYEVQEMIVRHCPYFLINFLCRVFWGWMVEHYSWEKLKDGRYHVTVLWSRKSRWVYIPGSSPSGWFAFYGKITWKTWFQYLWLILWSRTVEEVV